ncbi:MAG TPA: hypothetical protein VLH40_01455 [Atribacteraceae bacterium]|nr:hypothetical protein [Atribacteraceae bacterium]
MQGLYGTGLGGSNLAAIDFAENERRQTPYAVLWLLFFAVALVVQLVLLPRFFLRFHAGDGLRVGGDWLFFHRLAVDLSEAIRAQGWSAWTLRPANQAPAGIAAAIYALTVPRPFMVLPLNAALHATSAVLLLLILQRLLPDWRKALWGVLPFFFFPSTLTWLASLHKDGFFIAGFFCFILGWVNLTAGLAEPPNWRKRLLNLSAVAAGGCLVWIVRPYAVQFLFVLGFLLALGVSGWLLGRGRKLASVRKHLTVSFLYLWMVCGVLYPLVNWEGMEVDTVAVAEVLWRRTWLVPAFLDSRLYSISIVRENYIIKTYPTGGSMIDEEVSFHNAWDLALYTPRAFQIALLSPFPRHWLEEGDARSQYPHAPGFRV